MYLEKAETWLTGRRHTLVHLGLLLVAIAAAAQLSRPATWPLGARLVPLIAAILVGSRLRQEGSLFRRLFSPVPGMLAVAAVSLAVHRFWYSLPWDAVWLGPIWIVSFLAYQAAQLLPAPEGSPGRWSGAAQPWPWLAGEAALLAGTVHLGRSFWDIAWPPGWALCLLLGGWVALRAFQESKGPASGARADLARVLGAAVVLAAAAAAAILAMGRAVSPTHLVLAGWLALGLAAYRRALRHGAPHGAFEPVRWVILGAATLWLLQPFATRTLHGGGDAQWYATMLADAVEQARAGIFPLWLGQTEYQYSGVIYPLRVAPLFHYSGIVLDLLTFRSLGVFALQNLLITLLALGAAFTAYGSFRALLPARPGWALALAVLFLSCPGVLGIAYVSDLYMSWTTLPWVPLVWFALVRSFQDGGSRRSLLLFGTALGLCWWGHSPIALWCTLLAGAGHVVRLWIQRRDPRAWLNTALGAGWCGLIALYPIGSVLFFPPEPGVSASSFQEAVPGNIVHFLREAFPGVLLPLSETGRLLSDLQLGYAIWGTLGFGLLLVLRNRQPAAGVLLGVSLVLALLLNPIPGLDLALWQAVPSFVRDTTSNWVMNRLYLVLSMTALFGTAAALSGPHAARPHPLFSAFLACGCLWAVFQAEAFKATSRLTARPEATAVTLLRPENVMITRFAYLMFPALPDTYTHGANDPLIENRLLDDTGNVLVDNASAAQERGRLVQTSAFVPVAASASWVELHPSLVLDPARRYLHLWRFPAPEKAQGVLQYLGPGLFSQYALPEYGGSRFFGVGGEHRNWVPLRTSGEGPEAVTVRFVATPPLTFEMLATAEARLIEYTPDVLPVRVTSWAPYRAEVTAPAASWLETPRMYQAHFRASANGADAEVRKSARGFVQIRVPAGPSAVELRFVAPAGLVAAFWLSFGGILASTASALAAAWRLPPRARAA